jgi:hypothetical protein
MTLREITGFGGGLIGCGAAIIIAVRFQLGVVWGALLSLIGLFVVGGAGVFLAQMHDRVVAARYRRHQRGFQALKRANKP